MLPVVTEETVDEVLKTRERFLAEQTLQDLSKITEENLHLAEYVVAIFALTRLELEKLDINRETAENYGVISMELSLIIYSALQKQAEKDKITLPKVSKTLADAFRERIPEYMVKPIPEMVKILTGNPNLLRLLVLMSSSYTRMLEELAIQLAIPGELRPKMAALAVLAVGHACGMYELLEEAQEAEELARLLRR